MYGSSNAMQSQVNPLFLKIISKLDFPEVCDRVAPIYSYHCSTDITADLAFLVCTVQIKVVSHRSSSAGCATAREHSQRPAMSAWRSLRRR